MQFVIFRTNYTHPISFCFYRCFILFCLLGQPKSRNSLCTKEWPPTWDNSPTSLPSDGITDMCHYTPPYMLLHVNASLQRQLFSSSVLSETEPELELIQWYSTYLAIERHWVWYPTWEGKHCIPEPLQIFGLKPKNYYLSIKYILHIKCSKF